MYVCMYVYISRIEEEYDGTNVVQGLEKVEVGAL
jgi:hypothetical protein